MALLLSTRQIGEFSIKKNFKIYFNNAPSLPQTYIRESTNQLVGTLPTNIFSSLNLKLFK